MSIALTGEVTLGVTQVAVENEQLEQLAFGPHPSGLTGILDGYAR